MHWSSPQCLRVLFLLHFLIHIVCLCYLFSIVINLIVLVHFSKIIVLVHFKNGSEYLTWSYLFDEISVAKLGFKKFSRSSEVFISNFSFHLCLSDGICFQYSQEFVVFLLSERFNSFLIWHFFFFHCFFISTFHYEHDTFFYAKFDSYILAVYSYCLCQSVLLFFIFNANSLMSSWYRKWLIFFCDFVNL